MNEPKLRFKKDNGSEYPEWEEKKLGDIGKVKMCKRVLKEQTSETGDVPFYKIGTFGGSPDAYISRDLFEELKTKYSFPQKGSILISAAGTIGRPVVYGGEDAFFQDSNIVWLEHDETIIDEYLYQFYKRTTWDNLEGGTVKRLYNGLLLAKQINLPSVAEQQKIADFLSEVDEIITTSEEEVKNLEEQKKGVMQKIFSQEVRFNREDGTEYPEWEDVTLQDVRDKDDKYSYTGGPFGSNLKSSDYTETGIRIIQLQNIGDGYFKDEYKIFTSQEKADELFSCNIFPGDIIFSKMADPIARACIVPNYNDRYVMHSDGIRLKVNHAKYNTAFIKERVNHRDFRIAAILKSGGGTRQRIGLDDLRSISFTVPCLEEQKKIANFLSCFDDAITASKEELECWKEIKKGLLQQMFV